MSTLHVFLDESGSLRFNTKSSKYYIFAVAWTPSPALVAHNLQRLRYALLKQGHNLPAFHAAEDRQTTRNAVVNILRHNTEWQFAALVIEKAKVHRTIRASQHFYPKFATMVLRFVFKGRLRSDTTCVIAYTDTLPVHAQRRAVEGAFAQACRKDLPCGMPFHIYHHPRASNFWLQVADYCAWAVQRKWEQHDERTYAQLRGRLASPELDVLRRGVEFYY